MFICHIDSKFGIVDVQAIILISHKSPMQAMLRCIGFECIEFVFYLAVYVFVLAFAFAALGLNDPDGAILFHYKGKKSSTCAEKELLCMYIGKLLEICTTIRENIAREISKQRMAGKSLEELHANFKIVEPLIKNDFEKVLEPYMDKTGYQFSIKSSDSIRSKIEMAQKKFFKGKGYSDLEACKSCVIDAIRYTVLYSIDIYASEFKKAVEKLEKEGYKLIRCKNFWNDPGTYNGLNCLFLTPYGYFAEVQFHTHASKELNLRTHELYEKLRNAKTSSERKSQIEEEMKKLAKTTPDEEKLIDTIKKIKDFELSEIVWSLSPQ